MIKRYLPIEFRVLGAYKLAMSRMLEGSEPETLQEQDFFPLHLVQIGSGAHPASYLKGTRGCLPGVKAARPWSWPLTSN
jgi:hypothetical protein